MTTFTNLYPCASYTAEHIEFIAKEAAAQGGKNNLPELSGYVAVDTFLVPFSFVRRVANEVTGKTYIYGEVFREDLLFNDKFLRTLDSDEHEVLLPCVLMLIERGEFDVQLLESDDEEIAA